MLVSAKGLSRSEHTHWQALCHACLGWEKSASRLFLRSASEPDATPPLISAACARTALARGRVSLPVLCLEDAELAAAYGRIDVAILVVRRDGRVLGSTSGDRTEEVHRLVLRALVAGIR